MRSRTLSARLSSGVFTLCPNLEYASKMTSILASFSLMTCTIATSDLGEYVCVPISIVDRRPMLSLQLKPLKSRRELNLNRKAEEKRAYVVTRTLSRPMLRKTGLKSDLIFSSEFWDDSSS